MHPFYLNIICSHAKFALAFALMIIIILSCSDNPDKSEIRVLFLSASPGETAVFESKKDSIESYIHQDVVFSSVPFSNSIENIRRELKSRTHPDVIEVPEEMIEELKSAGFVDNNYIKSFRMNTFVMYVNTTLKNKSGLKSKEITSLNDLVDYYDVLNLTNGDYLFAVVGDDPDYLVSYYQIFLNAHGGYLFDSLGVPVLNNYKCISALEDYLQLSRIGLIETKKYLDELFLQGKLIYWISDFTLFNELISSRHDFTFNIIPIPDKNNILKQSTIHRTFWMLNKKSKNTSIKKLFKIISSPLTFKNDFINMNISGLSPTFSEMDFDNENRKWIKLFYYKTGDEVSFPRFKDWYSTKHILHEAFLTALYAEESSYIALENAQDKIKINH